MKSRPIARFTILSAALLLLFTTAASSDENKRKGSIGGIGPTETTAKSGNVGTPDDESNTQKETGAQGISSGLGNRTEQSPNNRSNSGSASSKESIQDPGIKGHSGPSSGKKESTKKRGHSRDGSSNSSRLGSSDSSKD